MKELTVAAEVAEQEFDRWADAMDLDVEGLNEEQKQAFEASKRTIVRAICRGSLVVNEDGLAVYTPQRSGEIDPLTFHERTGATLMAADSVKGSNAMIKKMYAILADLTRQNATVFSKLKGTDIKVCEALFALLMG